MTGTPSEEGALGCVSARPHAHHTEATHSTHSETQAAHTRGTEQVRSLPLRRKRTPPKTLVWVPRVVALGIKNAPDVVDCAGHST